MKRKIALLLASVMTLSLVSMNTFAASTNNLSVYTTNVPRYTGLMERNWLSGGNYTATRQEVLDKLDLSDFEKKLAAEVGAYSGSNLSLPWRRIDNAAAATSGAALTLINAGSLSINGTVVTEQDLKNLVAKLDAEGAANGIKAVGVKNLTELTEENDLYYIVDGGNFTLKLDTSVNAGTSFVIELNNAEWFFRQRDTFKAGNYVNYNNVGSAHETLKGMLGETNVRNSDPNLRTADLPGNTTDNTKPVPSTAMTATANFNGRATLPHITYDPNLGWYAAGNNGAGTDNSYGVYYRYGSKRHGSTVQSDTNIAVGNELAYALDISPISKSRATVTLLEGGVAGEGIVIPMIIRAATASSEVTVTISDASVGGVFNTGTWRLTGTGGTATTATAVDNRTSTYSFESWGVNIRENRLGSIKTNWGTDGRYNVSPASTDEAKKSSTIQLKAPQGFNFTRLGDITVGLEYGLTWGRTGTNRSGLGDIKVANTENSAYWGYLSTSSSGYSSYVPYERYIKGNTDVVVGYQTSVYDDYQDYSVLEITLYNVIQSESVMGTLYIRGLYMTAEDGAMTGDVPLEVLNKNADRPVVTAQTISKVATRNDYGVTLKAYTAVPTLVAGRYEMDAENGAGYGMLNSNDVYHKTAELEWSENVAYSWWAERETTFTLSENAKFRKVQFTSTSNINDANASLRNATAHTTSITTYGANGTTSRTDVQVPSSVFINDNVKHGKVTLSDRALTLTSLSIGRSDTHNSNRGTIRFQPWVSIEVGHGESEVVLTATGTSIDRTTDKGQTCVIAKAIDPVTVTANVTDLKIGYQYQSTADIEIKENLAGALMRNKQLLVAVTDMISMDMLITPEAKAEVVADGGDLKISSMTTFTNGYASRSGYSLYGGAGTSTRDGGTLGFTIERASTKASTIKISNVALKVDRTVPETNDRPYQVVAWGTAVAENFGQNRDQFSGRVDTTDGKYDIYGLGIAQPYVKVVSVAPERTGILTGEVHVSIGENYILVDGTAVEMDAAAYISPASNSTMVPIRFVANAFGVTNDQIIYDEVNRTVTLIHPTRTIQFTTGSAKMLVNGAEVTMVNAEGVPVVAENKGDRMYIPFRFIGNAFGVFVDWDPTTQTAKYIPQN